ncbi:hypothetical protein CDQ84_09605 [Clostridium thermosuccinogenes]|uniref:Stage 0 sporulation protein A homolog n=1 Tax=Clostridium thermosuccinogenes TaxID=84032 RepID=A0A2K2FJM6_9CLOT|nr:response regulator [Pseudoclostridium thermosuccinogenes]AUS98487.1 hypothetical protein CDO33_19730 [Pseudoclostridium thermosuccinogenes]PNT97060.1 hypothetical protein CDQ85_09455 [Pseudoclostridium thermosuccinogenes]PNT98991.1 hypothetical protein CDQ84_09605 [Pseudoclostridium thermosuccinogenes]
MYRILIADDEPRHRRGLVERIKKLRPDYEVFEAKDGLAAIEVVKKHSIDIAITDIKMPIKDGLFFLEEVSKNFPNMKVIMLSGYANFEYAQKALTLGAFDYVLKPLNDVRIEQMLQKAEKKIEEEKREIQEKEKNLMRLNNTFPVYIEHQLNQWVKNGLAPIEDQEVLELFHKKSKGLVLVAGIGNFIQSTKECTYEDIHELKVNMKYWMKAALDPFSHSLSFFDESNMEHMITIVTEKKDKVLSDNLSEGIYSFVKDMKISYGFDVVIGVGNKYEDIAENIKEAYQTALTALNYKFFYESNWMIAYSELKNSRSGQVFSRYAEEIELEGAIRRMDAAQAYEVSQRLLVRMTEGQFPLPSQFKEMVTIIFLNTAKAVLNMLPEADFLRLVSSIKTNFESAQKYSELKKQIFKTIDMFIEAINDYGNNKYKKIMQTCMEHINEHYTEDISLEALSEKFGFNVNYFSGLFKKYTNMTFSEYLLNVRMRHAQELLKKNTFRIYEISEKIGYKDAKYFIRVFKKTFGMTPDEFRRLHSHNITKNTDDE